MSVFIPVFFSGTVGRNSQGCGRRGCVVYSYYACRFFCFFFQVQLGDILKAVDGVDVGKTVSSARYLFFVHGQNYPL